MTRIAGYIITLNEEVRIERAIRSLRNVCDNVLVVDSGSTDRTLDIAAGLGCDTCGRAFDDYASQRNYALDQLIERYAPDFILTIDADEWLDEDLISAIQRKVHSATPSHDVYLLARRIVFDGRVLRWGGYARTRLPRLFRSEVARYERRAVNEHLALNNDVSIGQLPGFLYNGDVLDWTAHLNKYNQYSSLEASARAQLRERAARRVPSQSALRRPYLRRRWLREHVWDRLPARPVLRFLQIYVVYGGFLDGQPGLRRAVLDSWLEMCIDVKTEEHERLALATET